MDSLFEADNESTPLTEEETKGLKQKWVTLRSELNELEMQGILAAETWLMTNIPSDVLNEKFLRSLHKKMFESVWTWAGMFRTTERNIGVAPYLIAVKLKNLFADVHFWIENATFPVEEIPVRFHHKLVFIHPFPNGNGRIARLLADLLSRQIKGTPLFWGSSNLVEISATRSRYIEALRKADTGDYSALIAFTTPPKM